MKTEMVMKCVASGSCVRGSGICPIEHEFVEMKNVETGETFLYFPNYRKPCKVYYSVGETYRITARINRKLNTLQAVKVLNVEK